MSKIKIKIECQVDDRPPIQLEDIIDTGIPTESLGTDFEAMSQQMFALFRLSVIKAKSYGDSWQKHGEMFSVIPNLLRKMDRITQCASNNVKAGKVDGCGDLAVYSMLYLQWLKRNHPAEYDEWMATEVEGYITKYR